MTEKRFFYSDMKERRSPPCIIDMKGMRYCNLQEVIKPLNKLSDENEKLIEENKKLKKILRFLKNDNATDILNVLNSQENQIWELKKENEQLKSENQRVSEQKHIYKQDWKHLCIDKELLDSENEKLKSRVDDLKELNKIYVDFMVNEGYELADVMGK